MALGQATGHVALLVAAAGAYTSDYKTTGRALCLAGKRARMLRATRLTHVRLGAGHGVRY